VVNWQGRSTCEAVVRSQRPKGGDRRSKHAKVASQATMKKSQKEAESKRAPLATLPSRDRDAYFKACRAKKQAPTGSSRPTCGELGDGGGLGPLDHRLEVLGRDGRHPERRLRLVSRKAGGFRRGLPAVSTGGNAPPSSLKRLSALRGLDLLEELAAPSGRAALDAHGRVEERVVVTLACVGDLRVELPRASEELRNAARRKTRCDLE
jgi:hypothetical protein